MKKILVIISLLVFYSSIIWAHGDPYQFSRLSINEGLSNNRVTCIYKDAKGFMWFGTKSGLNRYDGYSFKIFKHDVNNPSSINDDCILSITNGPENKLWVKTRKGFNIYDPITDRFENKLKSTLNSYGIPDTMISGLKRDRFGNFWFMHVKKGLYRFTPGTKRVVYLSHNPQDTSSVYYGTSSDIATDSKGNIWVIYRDGVIEKIDHKTLKVSSRVYAIEHAYPAERSDYRLSVDQQNDVWAFAPSRGNGVFFIRENKLFKHLAKSSGGTKISSDIVFDINQDHEGLIWIATDHGGVNLLDKKTFSIVQTINNRPDDNRSISQDCIISLFKDNSNIMWLGTFKKGISYYHRDIIKFPLYRHEAIDKKGLSYDDINRFVEDKKGNIWIGSNGGGLIYFDRKTGSFKRYLHDESDANSLTSNVITALYVDRSDKLWIGTYFGGLDCFDGEKFTTISTPNLTLRA